MMIMIWYLIMILQWEIHICLCLLNHQEFFKPPQTQRQFRLRHLLRTIQEVSVQTMDNLSIRHRSITYATNKDSRISSASIVQHMTTCCSITQLSTIARLKMSPKRFATVRKDSWVTIACFRYHASVMLISPSPRSIRDAVIDRILQSTCTR